MSAKTKEKRSFCGYEVLRLYGYGASDILRNGFSSNFSRQSFSSEALGNRHCLNGDFQFRAATRNPENTDNAQNGANCIHWMPRRRAELKVAVKAMTNTNRLFGR